MEKNLDFLVNVAKSKIRYRYKNGKWFSFARDVSPNTTGAAPEVPTHLNNVNCSDKRKNNMKDDARS